MEAGHTSWDFPPAIVDFDGIGGQGRRAGARPQLAIDRAAIGSHRAGLLSGLIEIGFLIGKVES
jgi:hypothetical protein